MSAITAPAPARTLWAIDASHSTVEFAIRHLMIATVRGRFAGLAGTILADEADPTAAVADITIDAASIDTRQAERDGHLRSADFFDVARFPTITFRSTARQPGVEPGRFTLTGELTIRGVTRTIDLNVIDGGRLTDPSGEERAGFHALATLKRSDFGLTWNQALETGGVLVGDEVRISIDLELVKQA